MSGTAAVIGRAGSSGEPLSLVRIGALVGDPVRATILVRLTDGSRRPASELATLAGASPQAASAHLAKLVDGGLLAVEAQGRHRFYRIASGEAADLIEGLTAWAPPPRSLGHDLALCGARYCYDHIAGSLGVTIFDRMVQRGWLALRTDGAGLSDEGRAWCRTVGVKLPAGALSRRPLLRLCLDWTERRHHAGGQFGAALAAMMIQAGYLRRRQGLRVVDVTAQGRVFLARSLEISAADLSSRSR